MAIRVPGDNAFGDLLLATTGTGRVTRFMLCLGRRPAEAVYSTLLPYRTSSGAIQLAAMPTDEQAATFSLAWAHPTGDWVPCGTLRLGEPHPVSGDVPVAFDPVLNQVPGLASYDWVARLREPAYAWSRLARRKHRNS